MEIQSVQALRKFSDEKFQKINLFESERMFCDIYCFEPGQEQPLHGHEGCDKIYYVIEGSGTFTVGDEKKKLGPQMAVLCPPGVDHGVLNTGEGRMVLLVFMAPHPSTIG